MCTGNFGIEINEENLRLKIHLFENDKKSFSENLTKCPMDPKKFYTIAGSSLAGLLILFIARKKFLKIILFKNSSDCDFGKMLSDLQKQKRSETT